MKTDAELLILAIAIRDETDMEENTALRVGSLEVDIVQSKINQQVNLYPLSGGFNPGSFIPMWNDTTGQVESIPAELLLGDADTSIYEWENDQDYVIDEVTTHNGLWYQAQVNNGPGSTIVEPGTDEDIWAEINKASPGLRPGSSNAVYVDENVYVTFRGRIWQLVNATRPYVSGVFESGICMGDWQELGHISMIGQIQGSHGFAVGDTITFGETGWVKTTGSLIAMGVVILIVNGNQFLADLTGQMMTYLGEGSDGPLEHGKTYYLQTDATYSKDVTSTPLFVGYNSQADIDNSNPVTKGITFMSASSGGASEHYRGAYDLTAEAYPATGGTGIGGIPELGDYWYGTNSGDFDVEGLGVITLGRGATLTYIGGTVSDPASWIVKQ